MIHPVLVWTVVRNKFNTEIYRLATEKYTKLNQS